MTKYIVLVGDGMADYPLRQLRSRTPLEVARKPNIDFLAEHGILGLVKTVPKGFTPGTDVANLSILGYDPNKYFSGRGPLEALNFGIKINENDIVFRCNIIFSKDHKLTDYSAGHITTKEAKKYIDELNRKFKNSPIKFYAGISYRHLMVMRCGSQAEKKVLLKLKCLPPHDVSGSLLKNVFPKGEGREFLIDIMNSSRVIFDAAKIPGKKANMIWLWGQGEKPKMPSFSGLFGVKGTVISAVDIVKGTARAIGFDVVNVPGATGYFDTNYEGKAEFALKALKKRDFVFIHVEAPDEAGHIGDLKEKIKAIENIDKRLLKPLLKGLSKTKRFKIMVIADHPTPVMLKKHTSDAVPFLIYDSANIKKRKAKVVYSEKYAEKEKFFLAKGFKLMNYFLNKERRSK